MLPLSQKLRVRLTLAMTFVLVVGGSLSPRLSTAAESSTLVDEGISQIVTDQVVDRLQQFMTANDIKTVKSVVMEGEFRSLTKETLSQQMTESLKRHEIVLDEKSGVTLEGQILLSETEEEVLIMMQCTVSDSTNGDLWTVRVRKVLSSGGQAE